MSEAARALFARNGFARRLATRAVVVLGAVIIGGQVMRTLPREQTLIFPVGSTFPNATRIAVTWREPGDPPGDPRGGVTFSLPDPPPLQVRQDVKIPNGDYIVAIEVELGKTRQSLENSRDPGTNSDREGLQTNIERRVTLTGGETTIVLAAGGY